MNQPVTTTINVELCTGCGHCVKVCPSDTLSLVEGKAVVSGDRSLNCGHCAAICPEGAVSVAALEPQTLELSTVEVPEQWVEHGEADAGALVALMRSRRSCRNYRRRPVPLDVLRDLVKIGVSAPSGTNCQAWTFTLLADRDAVMEVGNATLAFFRKLNKLAAKAWLRGGLKLLGKPELATYHADYYDKVKEAMAEFEAGGRERLFHGAPAAILVASSPGATTPCEDALLASQNILLAAHAMGLGTCLVGFVVEASKNEAAIKVAAGIPAEETLHAVIALGYPAEKYERQVARKEPVVRVRGGPGQPPREKTNS